jgi:8-amino-7-oxononanoate synthase
MTAHQADWLRYWERQLAQMEFEGRRRRLREFVRDSDLPGELNALDRRLINFGSNDYLNLSCHPEIVKVIQDGVEEYGWGSGASPLVTGRTPAHAQLERALAEFEHSEAALLFSSGYSANMAAIVTLVGRGDGIFSDQLNHASLIDGCRLSGAEICRYQHVDMNDLAEQLAAHRSRFERAIIVTDSLFSMDGDLAPIAEICELAERYNCLVVADEAHATGIYGEHGEGLCHEVGCGQRVTVRIGTLSKAIGGLGGFLVGPQAFVDLAIHRGRGYMFSTSMPAAMALAAKTSIVLLQKMQSERQELRSRARGLRQQLRQQGWSVGGDDSPIIPIYVGDPNLCVAYSIRLLSAGCYIPAIRPPTVPVGKSLLRISLSTAHSEGHIQYLLGALDDLQQQKEMSISVNRSIHERNA